MSRRSGSRRLDRMARNRNKGPVKMNLTSLMDVFTILVFFLLVNSANTEVLETPKQIKLPDSTVEAKPRETVVVFVSPDEITVQGEVVARTQDLLDDDAPTVAAIGARLGEIDAQVIGLSTRAIADSREVTILADRSVPFRIVKKVMSTCTAGGYERVSLAVLQKATQNS